MKWILQIVHRINCLLFFLLFLWPLDPETMVKNVIHRKYSLHSYLPTFFVDNFAAGDSPELKDELREFEEFVSKMTIFSIP